CSSDLRGSCICGGCSGGRPVAAIAAPLWLRVGRAAASFRLLNLNDIKATGRAPILNYARNLFLAQEAPLQTHQRTIIRTLVEHIVLPMQPRGSHRIEI